LSESPSTELSICSEFSTVFSIWIPREMRKCRPPGGNPTHGKAEITPGRSPRIPEGAIRDRLTHCHSFHRHGTHTVGLGIFFMVYSFRSAVLCATRSPLVGYGSLPCTASLEWREAICRIYHCWEIAEAPPKGHLCRPGKTRQPRKWPGRLSLTHSLEYLTILILVQCILS
jgi:hypothetical protein